MIPVRRFKRFLAVLAVLLAALAGFVVLRQAADAILRSASGADPVSIFTDIPPAPAEVRANLRWLPDPERDGRQMEPRTRVMITDAYARALAAIDRAGRNDEEAPLADYLSGPALEAAEQSVAADDGSTTATFHIRHDLRLDFYSDDGSVVAVGVPFAEVARVIDLADGSRTIVTTDEAWRFVMLLEDGNWRVQQLQTTAAATVPPFGPPRPFDRRLDGVNSVTASGGDPTWWSWDPDVAERELDAMLDLGVDTVRVFLAGPEFGEIDLDAVTEFLDLATERGIAVLPTLFDGSADHAADGWRDDRAYLARVVGGLGDHPAIVLWDLKNEPDRDDERSGGSAVVDAWLRRSAVEVRRLDSETPLTIGWSDGGEAHRLVDSVDAVSFHHFGSAPELADVVARLRVTAGDRPVLVSEFGRPEWAGFVRGAQPAAQAERVADLIETLDELGVGRLVWQLRDPAEPIEPGAVAGRASLSYGLLRHDFSERPIARVVRDGRSAVPSPGLVERGRVWLPVIVLAAVVLGVLGAGGRWWRRRPTGADGPVDEREPDEPPAEPETADAVADPARADD